MNRQVVSSTVLTQSYSISLYPLNNFLLLVHLSIGPDVCLRSLDTGVAHSRSHGQMDG